VHLFGPNVSSSTFYYRSEALLTWKRKNGSNATYTKLIGMFEQAERKTYADAVRRIVQPCNNDFSEEHSQPQAYPASEPQSLSQVPSAMHSDKSTEVHYVMREGTPPEGKFANYILNIREKSYTQQQ
jgi:hypothetical protein